MDNLFLLLFLISIVALIIGLIKPELVIRWGDKEKKNRKSVLKVYGVSIIAFFVLFSISIPSSNDEDTVEEPKERTIEEEEKDLKELSMKERKLFNNPVEELSELSFDQLYEMKLLIDKIAEYIDEDRELIEKNDDKIKKEYMVKKTEKEEQEAKEEEERKKTDKEKVLTKEEKVDNLMVTVDSWTGKSTSLKFRDEITSYLNLDPYDKKGFESYGFDYFSTVVWGLNDRADEILIMANFDVIVYENYDFIINRDNFPKVKLIETYVTDSLLYRGFNYEAYAIQNLDTGSVELITQDEYTQELKNKDETFRKIY